MSSLISMVRRWRLVIQFDWLANGLFAWAVHKRHNAWMSAGEGLCAVVAIASIFGLLWKGTWWSLGLYPDTRLTLSHALMIGGGLALVLLGAAVIFLTIEFLARGLFLTSMGYSELGRLARDNNHSTATTPDFKRRLESLLSLNEACDMSPVEWWLAQRVWSEEGERSLREARLMHALPTASPLAERQRL